MDLYIGKLPPQAIEIEEAIIGAIMLESKAILNVVDIISVDSFYKEDHRIIYKAVLDLFKNEKPIDMLTVVDRLRKSKELDSIGNVGYLSNLTGRVASSAHIEFHARIIQQKFMQRELIRIASEMQKKAYDESIDVKDLLEYSESQLFKVAQGNIKKEPQIIKEIANEEIKNIEKRSLSNEEIAGLSTGLPSFDRLINGLMRKKLIIIAARPAMGKSILGTSISKNIAIDNNIPVAIFSLEMGKEELALRIIADLTGIENGRLVSGKNISCEEWDKINYAHTKLDGAPLFIDDTAGLSIIELRAKARRLKIKHDIQLIIVDYIQLMCGDSSNKGNREQEISNISRSLKTISKEIDIPIICLSQLNRSVESRPDKKPQLSDLRESGAIEQDADIVAFIYRPEYYGFTEDENQNSTRNRVDILIHKNRGGRIGDLSIDRTSKFTKIYEKSAMVEAISIDNNDIEPNNEF